MSKGLGKDCLFLHRDNRTKKEKKENVKGKINTALNICYKCISLFLFCFYNFFVCVKNIREKYCIFLKEQKKRENAILNIPSSTFFSFLFGLCVKNKRGCLFRSWTLKKGKEKQQRKSRKKEIKYLLKHFRGISLCFLKYPLR